MKKFGKTLVALTGALLMAIPAGCAGEKAAPIKIATKPMTEQLILGEMLSTLITQETGQEVELTKGIGGGTSNIQPALLKGDFDLYPEYTATGWLMVLKNEPELNEEKLWTDLQAQYEENYKLKWVGLYGFNNTYTLAVRRAVAEQYGLKTYSDLAAVSGELTFGGNADFIEREDGFNALCEAYGMNFGKTMDIDIGLKYQALAGDQIDVTNAYTTDAQLSVADVVVLEDDKHFFTNYYASTVIRMDALEKYPKLQDALMKMDGLLTDSEMAALNYQVEVEKKDEKEVANAFLKSKGLIR